MYIFTCSLSSVALLYCFCSGSRFVLYSIKFLTLRQSIASSKILTNRVVSLVKGCSSSQTYQQLTCLILIIHNHTLNSRINRFTLPYLRGYELSVLDTDPRLAPTVVVTGTPHNVGEKCARACCHALSPPCSTSRPIPRGTRGGVSACRHDHTRLYLVKKLQRKKLNHT